MIYRYQIHTITFDEEHQDWIWTLRYVSMRVSSSTKGSKCRNIYHAVREAKIKLLPTTCIYRSILSTQQPDVFHARKISPNLSEISGFHEFRRHEQQNERAEITLWLTKQGL